MAKTKAVSTEISIQEINTGTIELFVVGQTPMLFNRMTEKAWRELLMPAVKKNAAEKASSLKHDPISEYRASVYRSPEGPTELVMPVQCFKGAAMTAALDLPGSNKSQMGRLLWLPSKWVSIYGKPDIHMSIVRQSGINRAPDVRTRAILPRWCARFTVQFVQPQIRAQSVINVFAAGGMTCGVGDFRQEKGKGNYGQFHVVAEDDKKYAEISLEARAIQVEALENPHPYDAETEELLSWFAVETARRGFKVVS